MMFIGIDIPAPAPTMAVPDSICFLKAARISLRSVGGAILGIMLCREVKSDDGNKFVGGFNLAVAMKEDLDVPTEGGVMMWSTSDAIRVCPCRCGGADRCCSPLSNNITT